MPEPTSPHRKSQRLGSLPDRDHEILPDFVFQEIEFALLSENRPVDRLATIIVGVVNLLWPLLEKRMISIGDAQSRLDQLTFKHLRLDKQERQRLADYLLHSRLKLCTASSTAA
jgi:hypothetical protein